MAPSVRVRIGKKAKVGPCGNCLSEIPKGKLHAAVMQSFGKSQRGTNKWKGSHVHCFCLPAFLISDYTQYMERERKPKGRQTGSSLFDMPEEQRMERKHLIRTRARLLRLVLATECKEQWPHEDFIRYTERIDHLRERIIGVQTKLTECGGPPRRSMMRRGEAARLVLERRLNV